MSAIPVNTNSKESLPTENPGGDILRFDLCAETKEEESDKNVDSLSGSTVNVYPSAELEKDSCHNPQVDILEEIKRLENTGYKKLPIFTCYDAELYFIDPNGEVRSTFEKNKLIIFKIDDDTSENIFLDVGNWIYPLFSAVSPCYRSEQEIFVFPDIYSEVENAAVGLILPEENCKALHEVLCDLLDYKEAARTRRSAAADAPVSIYDNLSSGTSYIARNLIRTSTKLAGCMDSATELMKMKIQPQTYKFVDPNLQSLAHKAVTVSGSAASATGYLSSNLGRAVTALGRYFTPYVSKKVKETLPEGAVAFTLDAYQAIGNIYNGLEQSAEILSHSLSNNAVKLVEHRYGQPAGQVTSDVLSTVKNIYAARRNVSVWKPKSIAKGIMRSTGNAILEDRRDFKQAQPQTLQSRAGPDPLRKF